VQLARLHSRPQCNISNSSTKSFTFVPTHQRKLHHPLTAGIHTVQPTLYHGTLVDATSYTGKAILRNVFADGGTHPPVRIVIDATIDRGWLDMGLISISPIANLNACHPQRLQEGAFKNLRPTMAWYSGGEISNRYPTMLFFDNVSYYLSFCSATGREIHYSYLSVVDFAASVPSGCICYLRAQKINQTYPDNMVSRCMDPPADQRTSSGGLAGEQIQPLSSTRRFLFLPT